MTYSVYNIANQPREFRIKNKWYRWEPMGKEGEFVKLSPEEIASEDFKRVSHFFYVKDDSAAATAAAAKKKEDEARAAAEKTNKKNNPEGVANA